MYKLGYLEDLHFNFDIIMNKVFKKERMTFCVHSSQENEAKIVKKLDYFIEKLTQRFPLFRNNESVKFEYEDFQLNTKKEMHLIPNNVNYCVRAYQVPELSHPDSSKIVIAGNFISKSSTKPISPYFDKRKRRCIRNKL